MDMLQFVDLWVDGHLGCFQVVAMINKAAMDIYVYAFIWTYAFYFPV